MDSPARGSVGVAKFVEGKHAVLATGEMQQFVEYYTTHSEHVVGGVCVAM